MKQVAILSFIAAVVFAGIAAGLLASRPADQTTRVAELELKLKSAEDEIAYLKAQALEAAKTKTAAVTRPASRGGDDKAASAGGGEAAQGASGKAANFPESMAKIYQDPKMRETMKAQQMIQIEMQYAKLISNLQLDPQEASHFKQLLSDRLTDRTELGFKMMDKAMTPDQRKAATADYDAKKKASDDAIRTFLNSDEDYKSFQHWEDTEQERMQMVMGRGAFDGAGVPLSAEQEEQLISLMADVRKRPSDVPNWMDPKTIDPTKMSEEFTAKMIAQIKAQHEAVRGGATSFLTAEQLNALAKMQEQMITMTEAGMRMSRAMMGVEK